MEHDYIEAIPDELYFKTISPFSLVYIDYVNGDWLVIRETHYNGYSYSYKQIVKAKTLEYAMKKADSYLRYIQQRQKR